MKGKKKHALFAAGTAVFVVATVLALNSFRTMESNGDIVGEAEGDAALTVLGSIPYWDQSRAFASFKKHVSEFDIVSLFWYALDEDGSIQPYENTVEDQSIISFAHANGVKVLALIANLPEEGEWDYERVDAVTRDAASRRAHISEIVALVERKGFDGVNIDYEFLQDRQSADFSAFIRELANELNRRGKILAVAIHAQERGGQTRGQVLGELQVADILVFMTYDEHWETSNPGPIASSPWVRGVLEHAKSQGISAQKISLGMPLYGYDWSEEGNGWSTAKGLEYEDVERLKEGTGADMLFDRALQSSHFSYFDSDSDSEHKVWFEDFRSFEAKLSLAREYGLGGIALWRLGREDERIYDVLSAE